MSTLAATLLLAGSLSYHLDYGHTPLAAHFQMPRCDTHCAVRSRLLGLIPPEASVSAQTTLVPHVSERQVVYEYPQGLGVVEYVLLDITSAHYSIPLTDDYYTSIESLWQNGFGLLAAEDGYLLFKRGQQTSPSILPAQFYDYALATDPHPTQLLDLDFGPLHLIGADVHQAREGWVEATLYWQAKESVPPSYRPSIAIGYSGGELTAWHRQTLPPRWAQRGWQPGEVLRLTTGVSAGHGFGAGWGTDWTFYAGVVDDATGTWLEPRESDDRSVSDTLHAEIDAKEARLVPLFWLQNYWGITALQGQR